MIKQYNVDLLKILEKSQIFSYALTFIKDCFRYKGYLAGGFIRKLLLIHSNQFTLEQLEKDYCSYHCVHDIDFFFEDDMELQKFYLKHIASFSCASKNAYECKHLSVKMQLIKTFIGKPEDIISSFDLINVMVALKNNVVYVHEDWSKYEKLKLVHAVSWHSPMIVSRLNKYSHQGLQLSQETQRILPHAILTFIEQKHIIYSDMNFTHEDIKTFSQITTHVHELISSDRITNVNDLLLIASLHLKLYKSYNCDLKLNDLIMQKLMIHNNNKMLANQNP